jgi:hypothetical protein
MRLLLALGHTLASSPFQFLAIGLLGLTIVGCGEKTDPTLMKIGGVVKFAGQPLSTGIVNFYSAQSGCGTAMIDSRGHYSLNLHLGTYQVAVIAKDGVDTLDEKLRPVPARSLIPQKYFDISTSGLTTTVEQGKSQIDFDLKP